MGVGEVERGVQEEVGLQNPPDLITQVEEQTSTLQRNLPFLTQLVQVEEENYETFIHLEKVCGSRLFHQNIRTFSFMLFGSAVSCHRSTCSMSHRKDSSVSAGRLTAPDST